jgi:YHS domain-containing protein
MIRACLLVAALLAGVASAADPAAPRISLKGYDTVAYFSESKPVKGTSELYRDWDGARYYFASEKNRAAFAADPDRYVPQFSGNCAAAVSFNKSLEADPTVWKIVDGKLYVFADKKGLERLEKDPELLARSQRNWKAGALKPAQPKPGR